MTWSDVFNLKVDLHAFAAKAALAWKTAGFGGSEEVAIKFLSSLLDSVFTEMTMSVVNKGPIYHKVIAFLHSAPDLG